MDSDTNKRCGCKGIRTCLFCEKDKKIESADENQVKFPYSYCAQCNLCWPINGGTSETPNVPLYLGNIRIILDFLSQNEEAEIISGIDQIPWMPSQSGRKKQDFGPKVNFKKRKGKVGDFKGFPRFSESIIHRFQQHKELADFQPVELCHLDYSPDRGSAIEPHIDDSWIWGERLVTVNLASPTILTLTPANTQSCDCSSFCTYSPKQMDNESFACNHKLSSINASTTEQFPNSKLIEDSILHRDMCRTHRTVENDGMASIQVLLPPRSLLVLAGCARYNWFHAIKREDIASRRLAMTFRELSSHFLMKEEEMKLGEELLEIGRIFRDFNV